MLIHQPITMIGSGAWGTALAIHLGSTGQNVRLWTNEQSKFDLMTKTRMNQYYIPDIKLPDSVSIFLDIKEAVGNSKDIIIAVPSEAFAIILEKIKPHITPDHRILWVTKGLDPKTSQPLNFLVESILGHVAYAVLSGPSFAKEVAKCLPTAVVVASNNTAFSKDIVYRFNRNAFRIYTSNDIVGVELGGAVKNVIAIAAGISDGLHYGSNAKSALITRGLAEIMRLGIAMGADTRTFMGLSGVGDLILTCTDNQSRNRRFGLAISEGKTIDEAKASIGQVVEGLTTVKQVMRLAGEYKVEMPISEQIHLIVNGVITPDVAVKTLFSRSPKSEV